MSRIVREDDARGLQEKLHFARVLLRQLQQATQEKKPRGDQLALRGALLFHLYSVPVALLRLAAASHKLADAQQMIGLAPLEKLFDQHQLVMPQVKLVAQARSDRHDLLHWLDQQVMDMFSAASLALQVQPPAANELAMAVQDPSLPLGETDMQRLQQALKRIEQLLAESRLLSEEW